MMPLLESPPAQRLAWTLLHFLWQGTLLGLAAWAAFALLRHQRPHLRYLVGCACLLACLGCAVGTYAALSPAARSAGAAMDLPQVAEWIQTGQTAVLEVRPSVLSLPWQARLEPFLPWILALWASGVVALSLRTMGGWLWLRRLRVSAAPISEPVWLEGLLRNAGLSRTVRFLESVRVVTPLCMGLLRPVILLPLGFFANLDPLAAEAVLAHELAHIKRMDGLVNGLQCVVEVLFFFHPAVWWISRRIRAEREHCCDDAAVLACGDVILYAETLSRLDEYRDRPLSLALSAKGGNLMERLRRLLLSDPPKLQFSSPSLALLATLILVINLPAQAKKHQDPPPVTEESSSRDPIQTPEIRPSDRPTSLAPPLAEPISNALVLASISVPTSEFPDAPELVVTPPLFPVSQFPAVLTAPAELRPEKASQPPAPAQTPERSVPTARQEILPPMPKQPGIPALNMGGLPQGTASPASADCGPQPTIEEARQYIQLMAKKSLWGPRTVVQDVKIGTRTRWYAHLTNRWPRKKTVGPTIEGWEITFSAKPTRVQAPYSSFRRVAILVDKDRVVHWRTHTQWDTWDNIMPKN